MAEKSCDGFVNVGEELLLLIGDTVHTRQIFWPINKKKVVHTDLLGSGFWGRR
jgi:hypothetical protein